MPWLPLTAPLPSLAAFAFSADALHHGVHAHRQRAFDENIVAGPQLRPQERHDLLMARRLEDLLRVELQPRASGFVGNDLRARAVGDQEIQDCRRAVADASVAGLFLAA